MKHLELNSCSVKLKKNEVSQYRKNPKSGPFGFERFCIDFKYSENRKGDHFVRLKILSKKCYIRYTLYAVCVKFGISWESLELFTAQMYSSDNIKSNITNLVCKSKTRISQDLGVGMSSGFVCFVEKFRLMEWIVSLPSQF